MSYKRLKEVLSKGKLHASRGDMEGSLKNMLIGLKAVCASTSTPATEIRGLLRETVHIYATDKTLKKMAGAHLMYSPGQEKKLYATLSQVYEGMVKNSKIEPYEVAFERKQKMDKCLILGKKYLAEGKLLEAEEMFQESIAQYKDEKQLFPYIAKILTEAGHPARAIDYLRKGVAVDPSNAELKKTLQDHLENRK